MNENTHGEHMGIDIEVIVENAVQQLSHSLMNDDETVTGAMAETNASFDPDSAEASEWHFAEDRKEISFKATISYSGDTDSEKPWCGDEITAKVTGTIGQVGGGWKVVDHKVTACRSNIDDADG